MCHAPVTGGVRYLKDRVMKEKRRRCTCVLARCETLFLAETRATKSKDGAKQAEGVEE